MRNPQTKHGVNFQRTLLFYLLTMSMIPTWRLECQLSTPGLPELRIEVIQSLWLIYYYDLL